jgi:ATP-dependent Zn protease
MEEIKGLTQKQLYGMVRLQHEYYATMKVEQQRKAKADAKSFFTGLIIVVTFVALFGTMLYFDMRDPPMYVEATDGTLSINPLYLEMVKEDQEKEMLAEYYDNQYAEEEEYVDQEY